MKRRTTLAIVGASIFTGAAVNATTATTDGGPRIVDIDSETSTEDVDAGDEYAIEYVDGRTVVVTARRRSPPLATRQPSPQSNPRRLET
ncbi:hypothetical protein EA462_05515 [Natrarchaeobius halalkaliphilus]|uniref:Uncharacterized protein n=1 Tax=Natrarchaeobius halalkaliphilus TaxID=1679091 RepID=A0A3N6M5X6_9EURY|nr:hypothetical protein [Natrarchaeobius halalkaliphilus]RQG91430.1 hypothetical protein EA462_05515 [Natrarchaeobius halalkaliphilus]